VAVRDGLAEALVGAVAATALPRPSLFMAAVGGGGSGGGGGGGGRGVGGGGGGGAPPLPLEMDVCVAAALAIGAATDALWPAAVVDAAEAVEAGGRAVAVAVDWLEAAAGAAPAAAGDAVAHVSTFALSALARWTAKAEVARLEVGGRGEEGGSVPL